MILHGDCREVLPQIEQVDHVITDPPYSADVYYRANGHNTKNGSRTPDRLYKGDSLAKLAAGDIGDAEALREPVSAEIGRLIRRWGLVFSDVETCHIWRQQLELSGLRYVRSGAWIRPDGMPQMSGDRPAVGFEPCTIVHAQGPMRWNGGGHAAVWVHKISKGAERPEHPCPKPIALMRELVLLFTDPGETILDPFMGSGTTLVAAKQLGRQAIGIEIEEKYCRIAVERLEATTPPLALEYDPESYAQEALL